MVAERWLSAAPSPPANTAATLLLVIDRYPLGVPDVLVPRAIAGALVTPRPFTRILRARLLTSDGSLELCRDLDAPTHKLAGRHVTAFLAAKEHV